MDDVVTTATKGKRGRKADETPNTVFAGVLTRSSDGTATAVVKFNDADGQRQVANLRFAVVDNKIVML